MTIHIPLPGTLEATGASDPHPTPATAADLAPDLPNEAPWLPSSFAETKRLRHDGWDGPRMARFCAVLAESGVVTEACRAAGMSAQSAYALRHRDPVFAGAWAAALAMGRERLADDLLARAMKGEVVQVWQNGAIVAEQHRFDNKLALAILRRLDRLAETGATVPLAKPPTAHPEEGLSRPEACRRPVSKDAPALNGGWPDLLSALDADRPHEALTLLGAREVDEVDNPPIPPLDPAEREELERLRARYDRDRRKEEDDAQKLLDASVWQDDDGEWKTDFPPPPGFAGEQEGEWGDCDYQRACSPEELELLEENERLSLEEERAEAEANRRRYFAQLAGEEDPPRDCAGRGTAEGGGGVLAVPG